MKNAYQCIGLMSGTSMDGVDVCYARFEPDEDQWQFKILATECIPYTEQWLSRLVHLTKQPAEIYAKTDVFYGKHLGQLVNQFIKKHKVETIDLISSHGQTVFHNPEKGYTAQIGSGAEIAAATGIPTVCDLRSTDVALSGQGAPIVPLGEKFLFPEYSCFINIGGISNISFHQENRVLGYDVCMGNLLLDYFAQSLGENYDTDGKIAESGTVIQQLLNQLNEQAYFSKTPPKSMHADDVIQESLSIIKNGEYKTPDIMATLVEHIAEQLSKEVNPQPNINQVLLTGGGAFNHFLVKKIQEKSKATIVVPQQEIVEYKEALIMAFLGLKRMLQQPNVLASVTGATKDSINGAIYI